MFYGNFQSEPFLFQSGQLELGQWHGLVQLRLRYMVHTHGHAVQGIRQITPMNARTIFGGKRLPQVSRDLDL